MTLRVTLDDEHDILELYRLWVQCNADAFRGDWARVPRHLETTDSHQRCDYLERRRFRICKLTGLLYLHPHAQCPGTCDRCPYATETRFGETVCAITGTVLVSSFSPGEQEHRHTISRQDVERINVDSPFYSKKVRRVASFETVAGPVRSQLLTLVHNLIADCFVLHRKEDAPLIENLACAFFFHTKQNIAAFRRVTVAFLRILCTHPPSSFPQLPAVRLDLFNVRNWRNVVGCEQKSITQTEKRVLRWLRTFRWNGEWLIRPDQIRETGIRYMDTLQRCLDYESVSAAQLAVNISPVSTTNLNPNPNASSVSASSLVHNL